MWVGMFIAALFTLARTWRQPKRPLTDEWIKKMQHIYTMEYYSAIKRNKDNMGKCLSDLKARKKFFDKT